LISIDTQERYARVIRYSVDVSGTAPSTTLAALLEAGMKEAYLREFDPDRGDHLPTVYSVLWGICQHHYADTGTLLDGKALWGRFRDGSADMLSGARGQTKEAILAEARVAMRAAWDDKSANGNDVELLVGGLQEAHEGYEVFGLLGDAAKKVGQMKPRALLTQIVERAHRIQQENIVGRAPVASMRSSAEQRIERYEHLLAHPDQAMGMATGFNEFDRRTGGIYTGEVMLLTGITKGGKSLIRDKILSNIWLSGKSVVTILSEFHAETAMTRVETMLLASQGVDPDDPGVELSQAIKRGGLGDLSKEKYYSMLRGFGDMPGDFLFVEPGSYRQLTDLEGVLTQLKSRHNIGAIALDDLHNATLAGARDERDDLAQGAIFNWVKMMAMRLDVAAIAEVQEDKATAGREHVKWSDSVKYSAKLTQRADVGVRLFTGTANPMYPAFQCLAHRNAPDGFSFRILLDKSRLCIGNAPTWLTDDRAVAPMAAAPAQTLEEIVGNFTGMEPGELPITAEDVAAAGL
jgi:replicative DNA helicase